VETYLNEAEFSRLKELSAQLKLSRSELFRRLLMNSPLPNARDFEAAQAVLDLLQVNADLARLGNLLKLALDEPLSADLLRKFDELTASISSTREELKDVVRKIDRTIGRGAK
jgi:hypothetical protein